MDSTAISTGTEGTTWGGGNQPLKSSYGKMMMWFFIVSDALTFSGFLAAYGFSRFKFRTPVHTCKKGSIKFGIQASGQACFSMIAIPLLK